MRTRLVSVYILLSLVAFIPVSCNREATFQSIVHNGWNAYSNQGNSSQSYFPKLQLEPIFILLTESQQAEFNIVSHSGSVININNLSNIKWRVEDEKISTVNLLGDKVVLTGESEGETPIYVSAQIGEYLLSSQTMVTVHNGHVQDVKVSNVNSEDSSPQVY